MKKQLTTKTVYEPNAGVKVTVTNKPLVDQDTGELYGFDTTVTVNISKKSQAKELKFGSDDDIAEFMGQVEYDDPQQVLPLQGR